MAVLPRLPAGWPPEITRRSHEGRRSALVGRAAQAALPRTEARLRGDLDQGARPRRPQGVSARSGVLAEQARIRGGRSNSGSRRDPSAGRASTLGRRVRAAAAGPEVRLEARADRRADRSPDAHCARWPRYLAHPARPRTGGELRPRDRCLAPRRYRLLGSSVWVQAAPRAGIGRPRRWTDERIRAELEEFCQGRTTWPTEREFLAAGKSALYGAARHHSGIPRWTAELGLVRTRRYRTPPGAQPTTSNRS